MRVSSVHLFQHELHACRVARAGAPLAASSRVSSGASPRSGALPGEAASAGGTCRIGRLLVWVAVAEAGSPCGLWVIIRAVMIRAAAGAERSDQTQRAKSENADTSQHGGLLRACA